MGTDKTDMPNSVDAGTYAFIVIRFGPSNGRVMHIDINLITPPDVWAGNAIKNIIRYRQEQIRQICPTL